MRRHLGAQSDNVADVLYYTHQIEADKMILLCTGQFHLVAFCRRVGWTLNARVAFVGYDGDGCAMEGRV